MGEGSVVVGHGVLADALRVELAAVDPAVAAVIVPPFVGARRADAAVTAIGDLTDDDWAEGFDQPFETAIVALGAARRAGVRRIVVVLPTSGMSGAADEMAMAAAAEAVRITVKSAARQWGQDGVVVNALAVDPAWFGAAAGDVALSGRALGTIGTAADLAPILAFLASEAAHHLTGATLTADGGQWM